MSIYKACKRLEINYSTGKSIIKSFKKNGLIFRRKSEKDERNDISSSQKEKGNISR